MAVFAVVEDLLFRAKLEMIATHTGTSLHVVSFPTSIATLVPTASWQLVIIDLNLSSCDPIEMVKTLRAVHPTAPLIGYCSHVQTDLSQRAVQAGCTMVLSRSVFVRRLPELLTGK